MKKLIAVMASACAASLFATDGFISGTGFEENEGYKVGDVVNGDTTEGDNDSKFWSGDGDSTTVKAYGDAATYDDPEVEVGYNYLSVDSGTGRLERNVNEGDHQPQSIGDGLYVDTLVQFTASDSTDVPATESGDKILVWLQGEGEDTQLVVTAGKVENDVIVPANYAIDNLSVEQGKWYRLTVKVDANTEYTLSDQTTPTTAGFQVLIDGELASSDGTDKFLSLVSSGTAKTTITSVGFQGTGAVDNFAFTTDDPFPATAQFYVGETGYDNFAMAVNAAGQNGTVKLGKDWTVEAETDISAAITIDLAGFSVAPTGVKTGYLFGNSAPVTFANSASATKTSVMSAAGLETALFVGADLIIEAGVTVPSVYVDATGVTVKLASSNAQPTLNSGSWTGPTDGYYVWSSEGGDEPGTGPTIDGVPVNPEALVAKATSGSAIVIPGASLDGNTVTDSANNTYTFANFYDVAVDGDTDTVTLTLNANAVPAIAATGEGEDAVPALEVTADAVAVGLASTEAKLFYGLTGSATLDTAALESAENLQALDEDGTPTLKQGTGSAMALKAVKGANGAMFYKVYVTDVNNSQE